jgi:hypothetical protein
VATFNLLDPRTFALRIGGLPDLKFVYSARVDLISPLGFNITKYVTVRSLNLLTEEQILNQAEALVAASAGRSSNSAGRIVNSEVTGATRPSALGV